MLHAPEDVATRRLLQKEMREIHSFHATDRIAGADFLNGGLVTCWL